MKVYTSRATPFYFCNNIIAGAGQDMLSVPTPVLLDSRGNIMDHDIANIHFEDVNAENFRLQAESPAVDAGEDMMAYYVTDDFELIVRYRGQAFDAGAYESPHERLLEGFFIWPNPTLEDVNIYFVVPKDAANASLNIYDTHGRLVGVVAKGPFKARFKYEYTLDGTFLAQGIYYYTLETEEETRVIKVLHVK